MYFLKYRNFTTFFKNCDFFETRGKLIKMYTVLGLAAVFHKLIEENWKQFRVEISSP